ncbi:nucleotidyl transferase AbiEii/AbiGii toxin family protein [Peptoniphilus grossensis]|uniref:nucleotidyl transferase AbiEii/AbiGii toxin family protein n=1 Tax=Peptoniphilus grossensis TaxID=1465756 RepID=UPI0039953899
MNKNKLRALCLQVSQKSGLSYNSIQTYYFLERILKQIADSDFSSDFIFKGGFLLSNIIGLEERTTRDIDFSIRNFSLEEEILIEKFEIILREDGNDISFDLIDLKSIKDDDLYGGYRVEIMCKLENIKEKIHIDIATGDPITPKEVNYSYKSIFTEENFNLKAYNIETILAEKIETIYSRGVFNSRSKDFFDVYVIYLLKKEEINFDNLKNACINTFYYRGNVFNVDELLNTIDLISSNENILLRWNNYIKNQINYFNISFEEVILNIKELIQKINS